MTIKKISVFIIAVSLAFQFSGIAEATTTIEWMQWFVGEQANPEGVQSLIDEFQQENPDIEVELVNLPFGKMRETIITNFAVGMTADVLGLNMPWTDEFVELGVLEPLEAYLDAATEFTKADLVQAPVEEYKGHSWMVPLTAHPFIMYYNKDLLAEAGIAEPPTTWDELKDAAVKITNPDKNQYGYAMHFSSQPPSNGPIIDVYPLLYTTGGRTVKDSRSNLDSPEVVETLTFIKELHDLGVVAPGTLSKPEAVKIEEFATGRIGFMIESMPHIGSLPNKNPDLNFGVIPVPKKTESAYRVHGWEVGMSSKSKHKEEAWKFISFLMRPDINVRFAELSRQLPGNTAGKADFIDKDPLIKVAQDILKEHKSVEELRQTPKAVPSWQLFTVEIQKMLNGEQDPAATAKNAGEKWNALFDE